MGKPRMAVNWLITSDAFEIQTQALLPTVTTEVTAARLVGRRSKVASVFSILVKWGEVFVKSLRMEQLVND